MLKKIAIFFVVWFAIICVYLLLAYLTNRSSWKTTRKAITTIDDNELMSLEQLISVYPSDTRIFYGVLEYEDFIVCAKQILGRDMSKIYLTPKDYRRVVYSLIDDGSRTWIDWIQIKIKKENINLVHEKVLFKINENNRGEIAKI